MNFIMAMGRISPLILLLSGLFSLSSCVPKHKYFLVKTPKSWYEAQRYCREKCFDLATIDDMAEMETVLTTVEGKYDDAVWIGLSKGKTPRWHWSLADKDFYKEGERNYLFWASQTPNHCVSQKYGKLSSMYCGNVHYPVCFNGKKLGREQYVLVEKVMNWTNARDYCRKHHTDLASVRNEVERQIIQNLTADYEVWVGLFRDPWEWSDQTYSSMRYWNQSFPVLTDPGVEACVALLKSESGRWGELPCGEAHPFLCNCPVVRIIKVRISSQASVMEQNKSAVLDTIIKQVEEELRKRSETNVTLKWKKRPDGSVFIREP